MLGLLFSHDNASNISLLFYLTNVFNFILSHDQWQLNSWCGNKKKTHSLLNGYKQYLPVNFYEAQVQVFAMNKGTVLSPLQNVNAQYHTGGSWLAAASGIAFCIKGENKWKMTGRVEHDSGWFLTDIVGIYMKKIFRRYTIWKIFKPICRPTCTHSVKRIIHLYFQFSAGKLIFFKFINICLFFQSPFLKRIT